MASFIANLLETVGLLRRDDEAEATPESEPSSAEPAPPPPEEAPEPPAEPAGARHIKLATLMDEVLDRRAQQREAELARKMGLDASWKTIFDEAGLAAPEHGWTVEKALSLIRRAQARGMTPVQVRKSLESALVADGADVAEVARDALAKDEVLDMYEVELENAVGVHLEALEGEISEIHEQIEALQEREHEVEQERVGAVRRLNAWKGEKRHLEQQWAKVMTTIAPLLR